MCIYFEIWVQVYDTVYEKWRQEDQESKAALSCGMHWGPAWATGDPGSEEGAGRKENVRL